MIATLRAAFPEHAIVGKEAGEIVSQIVGGNRAGKNSLKWIVDPIDGAVNFRPRLSRTTRCRSRSTHGNEVTHAVVLDPVHDDLFTAIQGKGAQLQRHADPRVDVHAPRGGARRHRDSGARQREARRLPAGAERARSANARAFGAPARARSTSPTSRRDGSTASG